MTHRHHLLLTTCLALAGLVLPGHSRSEHPTWAHSRTGIAHAEAGSGQNPGVFGDSWAPSLGNWRTCAREGGYCDFRGTRQVRYGTSGHHLTGYATNGVDCTNPAFGGDPNPGVQKMCQVADDDARPSGHNRSGWGHGGGWGRSPRSTDSDRYENWAFCAPEGGNCRVPHPTNVRFGANGAYQTRRVASGIACTNQVFGDPIRGTPKQCEYAQ
jgi:hypothetical protein